MELTQKVMDPMDEEAVLDVPHLSLEVPDPGTDRPSGGFRVPPPPESMEEAGLSEEFVAGLLLKALHVRGTALGFDLVDMLALPMALLDEVIQQLQERRFVEVHSTKGPRRGEWVFKLTAAGRKRAGEEFEVCRYVGPAPVPFDEFRRWVEHQTIERARVSRDTLEHAFDGAVIPDSMVELLGPAINSGRSLFLFGAPGNGKTLVAERIARLFGDRYYVPHAVLVDGNVMVVHDPVHHGFGPSDEDTDEPLDGLAAADSGDDVSTEILRSLPAHDRRYVEARRPVVVTGGELTLEQLDLHWDATGRMYQAPPQLKAVGGVLVVDDLGRQRVPVTELLNRWVIPLEQRRDYLTLANGRTIVVPFDCFVIFSTNLEPQDLGDEAFLRRIHYKIEVPDPDRSEYTRIFRICCDERGIDFDDAAVEYLFAEFYRDGEIHPRRCHPRDLLDHVQHLADFRGEPVSLESELMEHACRSYFLRAG